MATDLKDLKEIIGAEGVLFLFDDDGYFTGEPDYMPLVCLTNTSISDSSEVVEKNNFCTGGVTVKEVNRVTSVVDFSAIVTPTPSDEQFEFAPYGVLERVIDNKKVRAWKIEGRGALKYLLGHLSALSDVYPAEGSATFSGTIKVHGEMMDDDPMEDES